MFIYVFFLHKIEALRAKDREHATILEEKMALHMKMVGHTGSSTLDIPNTGKQAFFDCTIFKNKKCSNKN